MRFRNIEKKYNTVSQLVAHEYAEYIGVCTDNKMYYIHPRNEIYDYVDPMSSYVSARYINDTLCIMMPVKK